MNIKYKIISIDPTDHSMVVRFYTDLITEESLSSLLNANGTATYDENGNIPRCRTDCNLNIWQIPPPTGQELEDYILSAAPVEWLALKEKILDPNVDTSMSSVTALIGVEKSKIIS